MTSKGVGALRPFCNSDKLLLSDTDDSSTSRTFCQHPFRKYLFASCSLNGTQTDERVDKPRGEFFHTNWTRPP